MRGHELAHLVYAGAHILIAPSLFEPCGLAPLIAMRYRTVPVVRATGVMTDTVFDYDHSGHPAAERNGYVFHHSDNRAIESALGRALWLRWVRPHQFRDLAATCMRADYCTASNQVTGRQSDLPPALRQPRRARA